MNRFRITFRNFLALQLVPALESSSEEALIGGQAVLEGVMMRSPHAWGIAVRKTKDEIATYSEPLQRPSEKRRWLAWPFIRGLVTLGQAMKLGYRALQFSANVVLGAMQEEEAKSKKESSGEAVAPAGNEPAKTYSPDRKEDGKQISPWMVIMNMVFSIAFFIFMYKLVPLMAATKLRDSWSAMSSNFVFSLVDGLIRLALFLLFIWGISLFGDIRRVFEYHGAEHKTVFAYEAKREIPSVQFTQTFSTYHPRCGTSFLMTIMLISIFVYAAFPVANAGGAGHFFDRVFFERFGIRILLLPIIASVSYEMIRFSAKHGRSLFALLTIPGLWLQRITTKPCADDQVECAIKALDEAMNLEKTHGGELVIS